MNAAATPVLRKACTSWCACFQPARTVANREASIAPCPLARKALPRPDIELRKSPHPERSQNRRTMQEEARPDDAQLSAKGTLADSAAAAAHVSGAVVVTRARRPREFHSFGWFAGRSHQLGKPCVVAERAPTRVRCDCTRVIGGEPMRKSVLENFDGTVTLSMA